MCFFCFRTSSASEYSAYRDQNLQKHTLSKDLLGPMLMGPIISLDDWVPERPPKNPMLRIPSPDLPPPPPSSQQENDVNSLNQDEPLPPPPPELLRHMRHFSEPDTKLNVTSRRNSFAGSSSRKPFIKAPVNFDSLSPPMIPQKSSAMELLNSRSFAGMTKSHSFQVAQLSMAHQMPTQPMKVHKVNEVQQQSHQGARVSDSRVSMRKRAHNSPMAVTEMQNQKTTTSPPLKPRMPIINAATDSSHRMATGNRAR